MNTTHPRRASLLLELVISGIVLGMVMSAALPMLEWIARERQLTRQRQAAILEVGNLMERITLVGTKVTNRGLKALGKMPSLQQVWLDESKQLTSGGIAALQSMLPGVNVHVMNGPDKN